MLESFFLQIIAGVIVFLIGSCFTLSFFLARKSTELRLANKKIDSLIENVELPQDVAVMIRETKDLSERYEIVFKHLEHKIDGLSAEVAEANKPGATTDKFLKDIEYFQSH